MNRRFITIDQILVNQLRKKNFIDTTQHTWKVLR